MAEMIAVDWLNDVMSRFQVDMEWMRNEREREMDSIIQPPTLKIREARQERNYQDIYGADCEGD